MWNVYREEGRKPHNAANVLRVWGEGMSLIVDDGTVA